MTSQMSARSSRPPVRCIRLQQIVEVDAVLLKEALPGLPVERRELSLDLGIIDQEESPPLVDVGRANGRIEDARLDVVGNWVRFQPPHRAGRVQRFVDIHVAPPRHSPTQTSRYHVLKLHIA